MTADHPLDRPVWGALNSRWRPLARGGASALRLDPDYGPFAAPADNGAGAQSALAALIRAHGAVALIEAEAPVIPSQVRIVQNGALFQMVADAIAAPKPACEITTLSDADGPAMR